MAYSFKTCPNNLDNHTYRHLYYNSSAYIDCKTGENLHGLRSIKLESLNGQGNIVRRNLINMTR